MATYTQLLGAMNHAFKRDSIFLAALLTAGIASGVIAARLSAAAMRWAIYGTLEAMYGNR